MTNPRAAFDEAIANMVLTISPYFNEYVFYTHLIAQCRVEFDENMQAPAGVAFHNDHYCLYLNPKEVIFQGKNDKGEDIVVNGFCSAMPLAHRIGILKHEMSHILLKHVNRKEDRNHEGFNIAADCALNQFIKKDHLPDWVINLDNFPSKGGKKVDAGLTAEQYYDLLDDSEKNGESNKDSGSNGDGESGQNGEQGKNGNQPPNGKGGYKDNHDKWNESEGDSQIEKEVAKKMTEKAGDLTVKANGNLPQNYSEIIDSLTTSREVDWKKVLRSVVGNKRANIRRTLLRRDRRLPNANWIKGKTKDRIFELGIVSDVSGSVSSSALTHLWKVILQICHTYNTPTTMVQVDTQCSKPETLTKQTKILERKACGGTILAPAIEEFNKAGYKLDAYVVTTDGYLCDSDVDAYRKLNKPVIWLIEPSGQIMNGMDSGKMKAIKLKESEFK